MLIADTSSNETPDGVLDPLHIARRAYSFIHPPIITALWVCLLLLEASHSITKYLNNNFVVYSLQTSSIRSSSLEAPAHRRPDSVHYKAHAARSAPKQQLVATCDI